MKPGSEEWFRAELGKCLVGHNYCEDCWFTCPKHPEGCCNPGEGSACNCGADQKNVGIESALRRVWNLACGECWKECQGTKSGLGRDGWPAPLEAYEIAAAISAKQVKP